MEITYHGANCIKITNKKISVVVDDNLSELGKKSVTTDKDILVLTNPSDKTKEMQSLFTIGSPGEYEVNQVSVKGIPTKLHYDPEKTATMYSIYIGGLNIAVLGHTAANLDDVQLEGLGVIDILFIPIGGGGYTIDSVEASKLIKMLEPKLVVPTHYDSKHVKYEVPQNSLDEFLKNISATDSEVLETLKLKDANLPEKTKVVVLKEQ